MILDGKNFKLLCAGCNNPIQNITKEHYWPKWLIKKTGANKSGVQWINGKTIPPTAATIPLCKKCNQDFGSFLEGPVSRIFEDIENGRGLSDFEAELLIRWLWKQEGLQWIFLNPEGNYTPAYTLRERVLNRIDKIRGNLILGISLIDHIDSAYWDSPLGLDSYNSVNAIFVSGVFSKIAIMVFYDKFLSLVPANFSLYQLRGIESPDEHMKVFYPRVGFQDDIEAILVTRISSVNLSEAHDTWSQNLKSQVNE